MSRELEKMLHQVRIELEQEQLKANVNQDDHLKLLLFNEMESLPQHLRLEACRELEQTSLFQEPYAVFVLRGHPQLTLAQVQAAVSGWLTKWSMVEWDDRIVLIIEIHSTEHADRARELGQTLLHRLQVSTAIRLGGSDVFRGTVWLREAYRQGEYAMQLAWYDSGNKAFADYSRQSRKNNSLTHLLMLLDSEFQAEMALSDYKRAQEAVQRWYQDCTAIMPSWNELREGCETVLALIKRYRSDKQSEIDASNQVACEPDRFTSLDDFTIFFLGEVNKQFELLQDSRQQNRVIETVKQFIHQHFAEELELNRLAEEVFLTPSYLSKLFKTETGETITDFLISVRIDRAKDWLREKNALKTYEVGEKVGYADPAYFNKVFKKVVGCTPKEFRDRVR